MMNRLGKLGTLAAELESLLGTFGLRIVDDRGEEDAIAHFSGRFLLALTPRESAPLNCGQ